MNPMEIISLIIAIIVLLKLILFLVKPKMFSKMASVVSKKSKMLVWVILSMMIIVSYFVFTSFTVVQVLPMILLGYLILTLLMVQYPKVYKVFVKEIFKDTKKTWLVWLIWTILAVCTLYVSFV
ncbi:hypothetical protein HOC32_05680 [Candidatus Woesearchaeota archaeon]|jgi:hypothetical protein|nr:hypothetical protein [Candidatus Woesearchaeota archaeon]